MEGVFENVRIFVPANPAQRIQLKLAVCDVSEECGKFKCPYVELYPDCAQLLLEYRYHQARVLIGRSLHDQMKTHAIDRGVSGRVKNGPRPRRIVVLTRLVAVDKPNSAGGKMLSAG